MKNVQPSEFKDIKWATTREELAERLIRIKSLQLQTAEKISPDAQDQFFQRITKRRLNREGDLSGGNAGEKKQIVLSYVLKATSLLWTRKRSISPLLKRASS